VSEASHQYLEAYRRYNYTTPKSYLELIALYKSLLQQKRDELRAAKERLENGVDKIAQASAQVADLQANLKEEQIIVEEKKAQTDELIVSIGREKLVVDEAVEAGREDEEAASRLQSEVQAFQEECTKDLFAGGCPEVWAGWQGDTSQLDSMCVLALSSALQSMPQARTGVPATKSSAVCLLRA
jgi:dynein heavy chain